MEIMEMEIREIQNDDSEIKSVQDFIFSQIRIEYGIGPTPKFHYDILDMKKYYVIPDRNAFFAAYDEDNIIEKVESNRSNKSEREKKALNIFEKIKEIEEDKNYIPYREQINKKKKKKSNKDEEINKEKLKCKCDVCASYMNRMSDWKSINQTFSALFYCKNCERLVRYSIRFKEYYDKIDVKTSISELKKTDGEN